VWIAPSTRPIGVWMLDRQDSPWYPTARCSPKPGWAIGRVSLIVSRRLDQPGRPRSNPPAPPSVAMFIFASLRPGTWRLRPARLRGRPGARADWPVRSSAIPGDSGFASSPGRVRPRACRTGTASEYFGSLEPNPPYVSSRLSVCRRCEDRSQIASTIQTLAICLS